MKLMHPFNRKFLRDTSGSSAIEAAICLPIVIAFIFGTFEAGIFFVNAHDVKSSMSEAVREVSITKNITQGEIDTIVTSYVPQALTGHVTTSTTISEQFGERFASIDVQFTTAFRVPFLSEHPVTSKFISYVILTDDENI